MSGHFVGILIKKERLRNDWSQDGLCKGICAVSYLSKIEQGKADASQEIIQLLMQRLGVKWYNDETTYKKAKGLAYQLYDALFSDDQAALEAAKQEMSENWVMFSNCPYMLDFLLFHAFFTTSNCSDLNDFEPDFDKRQQTLWLLLQNNYEALLRQNPSAYIYLVAGTAAYQSGNYSVALERLQQSYNLAAQLGYVFIMLKSRMFMGNCYSDMMDFERMEEHFRVAERLATALGDKETLNSIHYNTQSTNLELGHIEASYDYFSKIEHPNPMTLHKLAVCCEKLGKTTEALNAINRAESEKCDCPSKDLTRDMCELIRYRLEHPGYLKDSAYGEILIACFERIRTQLPNGFTNFHLPWILEWYTASRQYKQAYELIANFPFNKALTHI
ncbi:helix-turn-helix domain-containing protein [Caproicibacter sp.]|uniref:helix-turn-helix domain-containing protein n=1 Tax=Caproicibacter sp. TaxID=2814884 RepID=UPI00398939C5